MRLEAQATRDACFLVPGWYFLREVDLLWELLLTSTKHVEVGVFCGKSLLASACAVPDGAEVIGVDAMYRFTTPTMDWQREVLYSTIKAARAIRPEVNTRMIEGLSTEVAKTFKSQDLTSVNIDGNHTFEDVTLDIEAWVDRLRPGGLMIGHDYSNQHPGVIMAVEEFFGPRGWKIETRPMCRLWWVRKP